MGGVFGKKLFGERSSRVRNSSSSSVNSSSGSQARSSPINQPVKNLRPTNTRTITRTGRKSSFGFNNNNNFSPTPQQADPATPQPQAGLATQPQQLVQTPQSSPAQPRTRSFFNKLRGREINTNKRQLKNIDKKTIGKLLGE